MTTIAVHHEGVSADSTPQMIDTYHKSLGWPGIGYHFVVSQTGKVYYVGDVATMRYHVGSQNPYAVGIVLTGDFTKFWPLPAQLAGAKRAVAYAKSLIGHHVQVLGHRELPDQQTECPGLSFDGWKGLLL